MAVISTDVLFLATFILGIAKVYAMKKIISYDLQMFVQY